MDINYLNNNSFDFSLALGSLYLWLLFGFFSTLLNCDIQKYIMKHTILMYIGSLVAFFFLFTIIDDNNSIPLHLLWLKTIFVFIMFIMMTKTKYYFSIAVVILLLVDQSILYHMKYIQKK